MACAKQPLEEASERFESLLDVNRFESADVASLDFLELGPALVKLGDNQRYEDFRWRVIDYYNENSSAFSDRFLKIALLKPASEPLIQAMRPMMERTAESSELDAKVGDYFEASWFGMSVALFEFRRGNYSGAIQWCDKCLGYPDSNAPRTVTLKAIRAMALHMTARNPEARREFQQSLSLMDAKYREGEGRGTPVHGFWFDWSFSQILLDETRRMVAPETLNM